VAELPQASVAVHVRVTQYSCGQAPGVITSLKVKAGLGSHASLTVGAGKTGVAGQAMGETGAGQVMPGTVVSSTHTVWLQLAGLPQASVAVHVRVTQYSCGQAPGVVTSLKVTAGLGSHASLTVGGGNIGKAGQAMGETGAGQVMLGGLLSSTHTVWLHVAELPEASVAVQVRVTQYSCGQAPAVVMSLKVTTGLGSQVSLTIGAGKTGKAGQAMGEIGAGQLIVGGWVSAGSVRKRPGFSVVWTGCPKPDWMRKSWPSLGALGGQGTPIFPLKNVMAGA
jgi:hypothetical protein